MPPRLAASAARTRVPTPDATADNVFDDLRRRIITLDLEPGTALNRHALQEAYGLSSTPLRDALLKLADESLVDIVPQSATRVSLIDIAKARDSQFMRRALEVEVVRTLCALPERHFCQDLHEIIEAQRVNAAQSDFQTFDILDKAFHKRLFEAAGVPGLFALIQRRSGHIDRIRRLHLPLIGKMQEVVRAHELIVKAIERSNTAKAEHQMREHLSRSVAYSPKLKEKHPSYFTA